MTLKEKALRLAVTAHKDQVRKSDGSPYIVHPTMVGLLLQEYGFEERVVAAGFVHDVLEDTSVTEQELRAELGDVVADIVTAVSEDTELEWKYEKSSTQIVLLLPQKVRKRLVSQTRSTTLRASSVTMR